MDVILSIVGLSLSITAVIIVGQTAFKWRGPLRGSLGLFIMGFLLLGLGFLSNLMIGGPDALNLELALFALGIALLVWGAEKMFTFTYSS